MSMRRRLLFLLAAVALLGLLIGLIGTIGRNMAQARLPPIARGAIQPFFYDAEIEDKYGSSSGFDFGGGATALHRVRINVIVTIEHEPLIENADDRVQVDVTVWPQHIPYGYVKVQLESDSFGIVPHSGSQVIEVSEGSGHGDFLITPRGNGRKMLRVFAELTSPSHFRVKSPRYEQTLTATVLPVPVPTTLGISKDDWTALQAIGTAVGAPSLLMLCITRLLDARKKAKEEK